MYNSIEIKVEIVNLLAIWVGLCSINGVLYAIDLVWLLFDHGCDDLGIFLGKPSEKSRDTHDGRLTEKR